jgi:hypothetical protein
MSQTLAKGSKWHQENKSLKAFCSNHFRICFSGTKQPLISLIKNAHLISLHDEMEFHHNHVQRSGLVSANLDLTITKLS